MTRAWVNLGCGPDGCRCSCGGGCSGCSSAGSNGSGFAGSASVGARYPQSFGAVDPGSIINPSWLPPTTRNPNADYPDLPPLTVVSDPVPDPYSITYGLDQLGRMIMTGTGTQGALTPTFDYSPAAALTPPITINPAAIAAGVPPWAWALGGGLLLVAALPRGRRRR